VIYSKQMPCLQLVLFSESSKCAFFSLVCEDEIWSEIHRCSIAVLKPGQSWSEMRAEHRAVVVVIDPNHTSRYDVLTRQVYLSVVEPGPRFGQLAIGGHGFAQIIGGHGF
jgi:hypothetical protein